MLMAVLDKIPTYCMFPEQEQTMARALLRYQGTLIWNHLPVMVYNATSVRQFKSLFCSL